MRRFLALSMAFVFLGLFACSKDNPTVSRDDIQAVFDAGGLLNPLAEDKDEILSTDTQDEGDYRVTYETHDVVDNIDSIVYLGVNDDVIWPGSLIKGDKAHNFVYEPIVISRAPVTLSISLETSSTGDGITQEVDNPSLSRVRQGISDLLKKAIVEDTYVPARVEFFNQQVFSSSQMSLFVGADVSYGVGSLKTAFDWNSTTKKTKIVAKYKQIYYSIDMDTPASPAALLDPDVSMSSVRSAIPSGCAPLYVAGVSYGVMAIFTIETDFSYDEMNLAIDAAYKGLVDAEITSGFTAKEMLQQSTVRIVVYGGSTLGLGSIEEGFDGFMKVVDSSTQFNATSPGVPLVYKFRHACDNTLALITLTSQYTLVKRLKLHQMVRLTVDSFYCEMADDEGLDNTVDMDRFQVKAWAYNRAAAGEPEVPIIEDTNVYYWSTSGWHGMDGGDTWTCSEPNSIDIMFDNDTYDFDLARLHLWAWARDYDAGWSANENGYAEIDFMGKRFFENGGVHSFLVNSADFRFRVYVTLQLVE